MPEHRYEIRSALSEGFGWICSCGDSRDGYASSDDAERAARAHANGR